MADLRGFKATDYEERKGFEPMPKGDYLAMIVESERAPTKNGKGHMTTLVWEICEGPFKGRRLWTRLCLHHEKQQTVEIAEKELAEICMAVGVIEPNDSQELHDIPVVVSVGLKKDDAGEIRNEPRKYKSRKAAAQQSSQSPPAASREPGRAPWSR